ncbi:MAG: tetratricopeptide repeat protein [Saprospiraceae bacterium]
MENNAYEAMQEKIRRLVNGDLSPAEQIDLINQARRDPELAKEIEFSRGLALTLRQPEMTAVSALIAQTIRQEGFPPPPAPGLTGMVWKWIAGIMGLALISGGLFWASASGFWDSREQRIANRFVQPLENILHTPEVRSDLIDLNAGLTAYERGRYAEAIPLFERQMRNQPDNNVRLYLGTAYILAGQPEKSIGMLEIAANSQELPIRETALWYLVLAHLKLQDPEAAQAALKRMEPSAFYADQVSQLKTQLEK